MTRIVLAGLTIALLNTLVGCNGSDSGTAQLVPDEMKQPSQQYQIDLDKVGEVDVVEKVVATRQAYRNALELLIAYYEKVGNDMKLGWARNELKDLQELSQYKYIIEAQVAGPDLRATENIQIANYMYDEARSLEKKAGTMLVVKNEDMLRLAKEKYNNIIRKHPSSDKIDDAAYRVGKIYEHFKNWELALLYYKRAAQWDTQTPHPAQYRSAYILDLRLHRRAEAVQLYQIAVRQGNLSETQKDYAQERIRELTKTGAAP